MEDRISKLMCEEINKIGKEEPSEEEVAEAIDNVFSREKVSEQLSAGNQ